MKQLATIQLQKVLTRKTLAGNVSHEVKSTEIWIKYNQTAVAS